MHLFLFVLRLIFNCEDWDISPLPPTADLVYFDVFVRGSTHKHTVTIIIECIVKSLD